ncbi:aminotransferase [Colletotrichum sojae]|uniref:Aminotransferase n=1 Tax=Colletotrichum sojae TaxID=2175907 RepID=A0A8H6JHC7_9PEZI|nr:aminotransferase [Colletotrichum sojae]
MSSEGKAYINLQLGWPTPSLFPKEQLAEAAKAVLLDDEVAAKALVYGPDPGQDSLRAALAKWLSEFYQPTAGPVSPDRLFITNGASGALPMLLTRFTEPGYTRRVWMIEPTYFLACPSFQDAGFEGRLRGVPEDDEGIDIEFLRAGILEAEKEESTTGLGYDVATAPKVYRHIVYVVPTFSNPSAKVMSLRRREQLVELAREFDALVISDDVYDWLRWPAEDGKDGGHELPKPLPRLVDVDRALPGGNLYGNVVSNGSFSKIVAPGVRVGWIEGTPEIPKELCKLGPVRSGGCQGHLSSMFMGQLLSSGALEAHIRDKLIPTYRTRYQAMMKAIGEHLLPLGITIAPTMDRSGEVSVVGGFFTYLNLPSNSVTSKDLADYALEKHNVRAAHGGMMTVVGDKGSTQRAETTFGPGLRLCWAWHEVEAIEEGVERLATAFKELKRLA